MPGLWLGNKEKREYIRMNVETEVLCRVNGTDVEFTGLCKNLSHTGLQFTTTKNIEEGTELNITIKTNNAFSRPPLKAKLIVKRVDKEGEDRYNVSGMMKDVR